MPPHSESVNSAMSPNLRMTDEELGSPLQLLKDEYDFADKETRVKAVRRLKMVGDVLGPEAVRSELLPWLLTLDYDDDELMLALAEQLGQCVSMVGGPLHAHLLLPCLEKICQVDETVTREKAVEAVKIVLGVIPPMDDVVRLLFLEIVDLVARLAAGEWFITRVSACGLMGAAYARLKSQSAKARLFQLYGVMTKDDAPMVRRAAVSQLTALATAMEGEVVGSFHASIMPLLVSMSADEQDNVQLLAVNQCSTLAGVLVKQERKKAENLSTLLSIVLGLLENTSWRIRIAVAESLPDVSQALGAEAPKSTLIDSVTRLLQDPEADVRLAILKVISRFVPIFGPEEFAATFLPRLQTLMTDTSLGIRMALSQECMHLCAILEFDVVAPIMLVIVHLLNDANSEVRLLIVDKLQVLSTWPPKDLEFLLPSVLEMGQNVVWRIRRAILASIPFVAEKMIPIMLKHPPPQGKEYFKENCLVLYLNSFQDSVHEVRYEAGMGLARLYQTFGGDWIRTMLLPDLCGLLDPGTYYLIRINVIHSLKQLLVPAEGVVSTCPHIASKALEMVLGSLKDHVPNVRFTAVQVLQEALPYVDEPEQTEVERWIDDLIKNDQDPDVIYFASKASRSVQC